MAEASPAKAGGIHPVRNQSREPRAPETACGSPGPPAPRPMQLSREGGPAAHGPYGSHPSVWRSHCCMHREGVLGPLVPCRATVEEALTS
jgi:hypothetical protein